MTHGMWEQPRFHKWSHTLRSQCHPVVNWLQDRGILVHRSAHLRHHKPPFETNYCIVTGHMNPILDRRRAAKPALWCSQKGSHSLVLEKKTAVWCRQQPSLTLDIIGLCINQRFWWILVIGLGFAQEWFLHAACCGLAGWSGTNFTLPDSASRVQVPTCLVVSSISLHSELFPSSTPHDHSKRYTLIRRFLPIFGIDFSSIWNRVFGPPTCRCPRGLATAIQVSGHHRTLHRRQKPSPTISARICAEATEIWWSMAAYGNYGTITEK